MVRIALTGCAALFVACGPQHLPELHPEPEALEDAGVVGPADAGAAATDAGYGKYAPDAGAAFADAGIAPRDGGSIPRDAGVSPAHDAGVTSGGGCAHPPLNDPSANPTGLAPGPVVRYTIKLFYAVRTDGTIRHPVLEDGKWIINRGEAILLDSTQKNAQNQICRWIDDPVWGFSDPSCAFRRLEIDNPFLLYMRSLRTGVMRVWGTIDGVRSNQMFFEVR